MKESLKIQRRIRRKMHVRKTISGTADRPRLTVYKSNRYLFAQVVDDEAGKAFVGLLEKKLPEKKDENPMERAARMGKEFAKLLKEKKIATVVFDRNGYPFHGRIKAFADAVRSEGINF